MVVVAALLQVWMVDSDESVGASLLTWDFGTLWWGGRLGGRGFPVPDEEGQTVVPRGAGAAELESG